jgi:hypothetical protein
MTGYWFVRADGHIHLMFGERDVIADTFYALGATRVTTILVQP